MTSTQLDRVAVLAFDDMTALDAVGPAEAFNVCTHTVVSWVSVHDTGFVTTDAGLRLPVQSCLESDVETAEIIIVPGGPGQEAVMSDQRACRALRDASMRGATVASVCTGSLILGAAGLLTGVNCTGHWLTRDRLEDFRGRYQSDRVVRDGTIWTSAGVSAGIELGLHLIAHRYGTDEAIRTQTVLEYFPDCETLPARRLDDVPHEVRLELAAESKHV